MKSITGLPQPSPLVPLLLPPLPPLSLPPAMLQCCNVTLSIFQGGLKAVIWTDAFQMSVILVGFITLASMAVKDAGGVEEVYQRALDGGRLYWNE